jgi:dTDP-4-dehydrorhamnose 3,5-epimerase
VIFEQTDIPGAFVIRGQPAEDERGYFARLFCEREFEQHGLETRFVQDSVSYNRKRGTLRGMHFQAAPHEETKLVSCHRGAIYDVIVDLRPESPRYRRWTAATLTAQGLEALYVPKGCAHGFIALEDETIVRYAISAFHVPGIGRGVRYDDPAFNIVWPMVPTVVNERDRSYPLFDATPGSQR